VRGSLSDNALSEPDALPDELGAGLRTCLHTLWLARNGLRVVPQAVCALTSLRELDLSGNGELSALPAALGALRQLHTLDLAQNAALTWPPTQVTKQGAEAVCAWLLAQPKQPPPEAVVTDSASPVAEEVEAVLRGGDGDGSGGDGSSSRGVVYAHEPAGSMHMPTPMQLRENDEGGEFIFPGRAS
jgi:hypothetical protein